MVQLRDGRVGAAISSYPPNSFFQYNLPKNLNIYYAEAFAIFKALEFIVSHDIKNSCIISDSSSVIRDIAQINIIKSPCPYLISKICNLLAQYKPVNISWLPGHSNANIPSVDYSAKQAAYAPTLATHVTFTCTEATCVLEGWIRDLWNREWDEKPSCSYQRMFKTRKKKKCVLKTRNLDSAINRIRLMQTKLNGGKYKIGLHPDGKCNSCQVLQDCNHFIFECTDTVELREKLKKLSIKHSICWDFENILSHHATINEIAKYIVDNKVEI